MIKEVYYIILSSLALLLFYISAILDYFIKIPKGLSKEELDSAIEDKNRLISLVVVMLVYLFMYWVFKNIKYSNIWDWWFWFMGLTVFYEVLKYIAIICGAEWQLLKPDSFWYYIYFMVMATVGLGLSIFSNRITKSPSEFFNRFGIWRKLK